MSRLRLARISSRRTQPHETATETTIAVRNIPITMTKTMTSVACQPIRDSHMAYPLFLLDPRSRNLNDTFAAAIRPFAEWSSKN